MMNWISIPQLARTTGLRMGMIRDMVDSGLLKTYQNKAALQRNGRAKHMIAPEDLNNWFETVLEYPPEKTMSLMQKLFPYQGGWQG